MVIAELTVEVEGALRENRYAKQRMKARVYIYDGPQRVARFNG
jgi:hypothetical protein